MGTLTSSGLNWSGVEYTSLDFFKRNKKANVRTNDILFTSSAHSASHICKKVDVVSDVPEEYQGRCLFVGELMALRNTGRPKINPYYLASFLRSSLGRTQVQRCTRGISSHLYEVDMKKYVSIPLPQKAVVDEVAKLASEAEAKKHRAQDIVKRLVADYEKSTGLRS